MSDHFFFLTQCRQLAAQAAAAGNSAVGAVVVRDGAVIGAGAEAVFSKADVTCHAEIEAVRDAVRRTGTVDLSRCTLYTTCEPCVMCAYVIRYHQVHTVVYETPAPEVGGISSKFPVLSDVTFWSRKPVPQVIHLQQV